MNSSQNNPSSNLIPLNSQGVAAEISSVESELSQLLIRLQFIGTHLVGPSIAHSRRVRQIADDFIDPLKMLHALHCEINAEAENTDGGKTVMNMKHNFHLVS